LSHFNSKSNLRTEILGSHDGEYEGGRVIALMMEAASTSVTSVNVYETTRHNKPEDSHLKIRRHENLKSHKDDVVYESCGISKSQNADDEFRLFDAQCSATAEFTHVLSYIAIRI
jgi:hypothetical protein